MSGPSNAAPAFTIGDVPIFGRRILAPMDGLSDLPFRRLCRSFGSAISYTPFVAADAVLSGSDRALAALEHADDEHPLAFQIFDDDEDRLRRAAIRLADRGPDLIDVNMGCSVRCVSGRGAGAGLLRDPAKVGRIIAALSEAVSIPVTAKIRLGWDDGARNYLEIARVIQDSGGRAVAVHGRTRAQGYSGTAEWDPIGEIKAAVAIPVIGNGDVRTPEDAVHMLRHTGCDAVMIGRGAIGNPWIFHEHASGPPAHGEILDLIERHLCAMIDHYGEDRGGVLFRKHLARYLDHLDTSAEVRRSILTGSKAEDIRARLTQAIRPSADARATGASVRRDAVPCPAFAQTGGL